MKAKTAFMVNDGTWYKVYDKFYDKLKKWGRFELVQKKDDADIMIVLSTHAGEEFGVVPVVGVGAIGGAGSRFYIKITGIRNDTPLWSDSTGEAGLVSNSAKVLVRYLKKKMERK